MSSGSAAVNEALSRANRIAFEQYVDIAVVALISYEYLITFAREKQYIWTARWSSYPKILFLVSRYIGLLSQVIQSQYSFQPSLSFESCTFFLRFQTGITYLLFAITEALLLLRTSALYRGTPKVLLSLSLVYFVSVIGGVAAIALWSKHLAFQPTPAPTIVGCSFKGGNPAIIAAFGILGCWQFGIAFLAFWKGWREHRANGVPLYLVLYRDGFQYYFYSCLVTIGNAIIIIVASPRNIGLVLSIERASHAICASRLLLHVRSLSRPQYASRSRSIQSIDIDLVPLPYSPTTPKKRMRLVQDKPRRHRSRLSTVIEFLDESDESPSRGGTFSSMTASDEYYANHAQ